MCLVCYFRWNFVCEAAVLSFAFDSEKISKQCRFIAEITILCLGGVCWAAVRGALVHLGRLGGNFWRLWLHIRYASLNPLYPFCLARDIHHLKSVLLSNK